MHYIHNQFDVLSDAVIEVTLDRAANVQLLDDENFNKYKNGEEYEYLGGYATTSPIRLTVPRSGRWHVVIDLGGGAGRVKAAPRMLVGAGS